MAMKRSPRRPRSAAGQGGARPPAPLSPVSKSIREQSATFPTRASAAAHQSGRPLAFAAGPALHDDGQSDRRRGDDAGRHRRSQIERLMEPPGVAEGAHAVGAGDGRLILLTINDITARKKAERRLRRAE